MFTSPYPFFDSWFQRAAQEMLPQFDAMVLITATTVARPSGRMVLLKGVVDGSFRFFTNYESRKAKELLENPQAQLLFYWPQHGHQIRVEGNVVQLSSRASDEYFATRPRESRIGAIASKQSQPLGSMEELKARIREVEAEYPTGEVHRPENWGGFALVPDRFEFWRDGEHRLHERIVYQLSDGEWIQSRLWP